MIHTFQNKTILIPGGAGFIGSHLTRYFLDEGAYVRVLDNYLTGFKHNIEPFLSHPRFTMIEGDITNLETCRQAAQGVHLISHQAALGSVPRSFLFPEKTNEINVQGFLNILIAAKENNVERMVYASSSSVYGDEYTLPKVESKIGHPLSPYAVSKYTNELYAHVFSASTDLKLIGLRYFNVFGPNQDPHGVYAAVIPLFIQNIIDGTPVCINGDGLQTRDFTFVANAVQANARALSTENSEAYDQIYNVACGANYTLIDMLHIIEKFLNKKANIIYREDRKGDIRDSLADISKIESMLGYHPSHTFEQGLQETVQSLIIKNEKRHTSS